ncbi:hypothetical protein ACWHAM_06375 [Paenibacillus terrae]
MDDLHLLILESTIGLPSSTNGETALSLAVQQGHPNVAECLRQHGATS